MSNISSILTSLASQTATLLGSDWKELDYVYDLEMNEFRSSDKRYGVGALSGSSVSGTTKSVTVDFSFFVVLTRTYVNRSDDGNERAVLSDIYDKIDTLNEAIFQRKLNNANVLLVSELSFDSPEKIDTGTISVKVNFVVKYRDQTI